MAEEGPGGAWYQQVPPDDPDARMGNKFFTAWDQLRPYGDTLVIAFMRKPMLRKKYYSYARSWRERPGQYGEKWCDLMERELGIGSGTLQREDFASLHKYLFWNLATALYQQTGHVSEDFPPHDGPFTALSFHGVPNGDQSGGLDPGGIGVPP